MGHPEDLLFITPVETIGNWIFPLFHSEEALDKKTSILHKLAKVAKRMALAKPSPSGCLSPLLVRGRALSTSQLGRHWVGCGMVIHGSAFKTKWCQLRRVPINSALESRQQTWVILGYI
jgi:hypothetical protein